jgi:hypothetical protein
MNVKYDACKQVYWVKTHQAWVKVPDTLAHGKLAPYLNYKPKHGAENAVQLAHNAYSRLMFRYFNFTQRRFERIL